MSRSQQQHQKIQEVIQHSQDAGANIDHIAKIRGWFRPEDGSAFYPVVQAYLKGDIEINEASSKMFDPIDEKIAASRLDDVKYMDLWFGIIHTAKKISLREKNYQDKVTDLVAAFKGHEIKGNEKYNYLYSSLTDFELACREAYNDALEPSNGFHDIEVSAWANMNFFFARVTDKGLCDLSLYAIWAMRQALETEAEDDDESTAVQKYDAYIPAAAAWIFGVGRDLFRTEKDLTPSDSNQGNPARGGPLWKGKAEFSQERWAFWKERLATVGKMEKVSDKTGTLARDAVEHMERAETFERI